VNLPQPVETGDAEHRRDEGGPAIAETNFAISEVCAKFIDAAPFLSTTCRANGPYRASATTGPARGEG